MNFLKKNSTPLLTGLLVMQVILFYGLASRAEKVPNVLPLASFPSTLGPWTLAREYPLEQEVLDVLKADDTLNRMYVDEGARTSGSLFVAFFKTQRMGQAPHSPKNCLPGAGWEPLESGTITIPVQGWNKPIEVNRYVVAHGESRNAVLYWYHSNNRVIASEYWAKIWLVLDAIRYQRSDTALVRVLVPVVGGDSAAAVANGIRLVQAAFPAITRQFPS